jgi:hypothetical protein
MKDITEIAENLHDEALVLEGLDDCILGYSENGILIYSYARMLDYFTEIDGMDEEEAAEWIDYNVMGLMPNGLGFIMCYEV